MRVFYDCSELCDLRQTSTSFFVSYERFVQPAVVRDIFGGHEVESTLGSARSYKELQGVIKNYKELQRITRSYKELQGVTKNYKEL